MMKRRTLTTLAAAAVLAMNAPLALAKADTVIKLGHIANEQHSWHKGSQKFAEEVARLTEGRVGDIDARALSHFDKPLYFQHENTIQQHQPPLSGSSR